MVEDENVELVEYKGLKKRADNGVYDDIRKSMVLKIEEGEELYTIESSISSKERNRPAQS